MADDIQIYIAGIDVPQGDSCEDIKTRKQIIKDFYASWNASHPDKKVWNKSLRDYIYVKYLSINETIGHASISYDSTMAVIRLTEILEMAVVVKTGAAKSNDKNQRPFDQMIVMMHQGIRLLVGHQKSTGEYVQYCITKKASLGR